MACQSAIKSRLGSNLDQPLGTNGGGTLGASGPWSSSANMDLTGGSATVDTRGGNISLSGILSGTGGLTTAGPGLLILSGDNTYGGGTAVDAGTLDVANSDALPDGTSLTVGAGGPFAPDFSAGAEPGKAAGGAASPGAAVAAVPEPGSLALLLAALSSAAACYPFSRRVREQG